MSPSAPSARPISATVREVLDAYGVAYTLEPTLVRGLDYYTRTVFEFVGPEEQPSRRSARAGATTA